MNDHEERSEVFRGHLDECVRHLGAAFSDGQAKVAPHRRHSFALIGEFCRVSLSSVERWFKGEQFPNGDELTRLACCLETMGYRIIEMERRPAGKRHFTELIGYGLMSSQEAATLLGYASPRSVNRILQGTEGTSEEKEQIMWEAWKSSRDKLDEAKRKAAMRLPRISNGGIKPPHVTTPIPVTRPEAPRKDMRAVVSIMEGLCVMLEATEADDLRSHADMVLRLSARLSTLSSKLILFDTRTGGGE